MRVTMVGVGMVGSFLGPALAAAGHEVTYAVRDPADARHDELLARTPNGGLTSVATAAHEADVVVLAVPWHAALDVVTAMGDMGGTVLADATNTLLPGFVMDTEAIPSGAHLIAKAATNARLVKAFNVTGKENLADPRYPEGGASLPICGDDENARATVAALAGSIGFEVVDCGELDAARSLEHLAWLWIRLAIPLGMGRDIAWRVAHR